MLLFSTPAIIPWIAGCSTRSLCALRCEGAGNFYLETNTARLARYSCRCRACSLTWDAVSTMYGQYALGLDPKGQY
jgi:hypothetical protein